MLNNNDIFKYLISKEVLDTNVVNSFCKFYPSDLQLLFEHLPLSKNLVNKNNNNSSSNNKNS